MGIWEVITTLIGALAGGAGSFLFKWQGMRERRMDQEHELALLQMQHKQKASETEQELAIIQHQTYAQMREASYVHDSKSGTTSRWVNNCLRLVRPVLTLMLVILVWYLYATLEDTAYGMALKHQIIDGVLFMASAAFAWWFGDRAPQKKLPWQ